MRRLCNPLISVAAVAALWGDAAHADNQPPAPSDAPAEPPPDARPGAPAEVPPLGPPSDVPADVPPVDRPSETPSSAPLDPASGLPFDTGLAPGEAIEIFDERPDKPFDRDTELRLTGEELAARGAVDLATALALLPDVSVRDAGRGGFNIDIRGARKGAVSVLIDGVLVTDPYYGAFDVSTIPITDIVQIRVATTPLSPIDGPGGPGGVIEVHTRDAIGPQLVIGRLTADSLPSVGMTGTARIPLPRALALRLSASGLGGAHDLALANNTAIGEERRAVTGAGRLEYRRGNRRIAIDGFVDDRHYVAPPSDATRATIRLIDRETTARTSIKGDDKIGTLQLQGEAWSQYLARNSRFFADPALTSQQEVEFLKALRSGVTALATRPFLRDFRWAASTTIDFEKVAVSNIMNQVVRGKTTIVEPAADLQYERRRLRADVAAGLAVPLGVGARPWPEAKAVVKYRPRSDLELTATGAYKGRIPSLRERFDVAGNPALGPERIAHAELRAVEQVGELVHVELAPYYKHSTGTIRASADPMDMGQLVNLGVVTFWGVDGQARVSPHRLVDAGGGYEYVRARSSDTGDDPIDRLPHHRWDAWVQGRPAARISALARVKYFGAAIDAGKRVGAYALIEANVTAQITRQYLGVLRVDDLLDVRPETRAGYRAPGRVISVVMQGTWE